MSSNKNLAGKVFAGKTNFNVNCIICAFVLWAVQSVRGGKGGGLSAGSRGGRMKRTRKTLRQKAQQGQAQRRAGAERARSPSDGHLFAGGLRGSDRDGAPPGSGQGGAGQLGRHAGLLCTQMPPNYDPAKPSRFNFSLCIGKRTIFLIR